MNEENKKTILFLLNGFGMEASKSWNVYSASLMPNLDRISHAYPFTSMPVSDVEAGLNKHQIGNFKSNYLMFSTEGNVLRKEDIIDSKLASNEIANEKILTDLINYTIQNNSRFHILFNIGNKYSENTYKQLKYFCDVCANIGIKEIYLHLFVGDNTNPGQKTAINCINSLKFHTLSNSKIIKVASIANKRILTDESSEEEKRNYYRMLVSGVGEIWSDYSDVIERAYRKGQTDDNIASFLTKKETVIKDKDGIVYFNYDNNMGGFYLDILTNPHNYFTAGKLPLGIKSISIFEVNDTKVPFCYSSELPNSYFLENIPENKKILLIAAKDRIGYIANTLNGFRREYKSNLNICPVEVKEDHFNIITKYLLAYQEQNMYDLIIVDYSLMTHIDKKEIATLKKNMSTIDNCLGAVYNKAQEKGQDLIITSLYGEVGKLSLVDREFVNVNFSEKTPLIVTGKGIARGIYQFAPSISLTKLASLLYTQLGMQVKNPVFGEKAVGKKNNKLNQLIIIFGVLAIALVFMYLYIKNN